MANGPRKAEIQVGADLTPLNKDVKKGERTVERLSARARAVQQQLRLTTAQTGVAAAQTSAFSQTVGRQVATLAGFGLASTFINDLELPGAARGITNIGIAVAFGAQGGPIMAAFAGLGAAVGELTGYITRVDAEVATIRKQFDERDETIKRLEQMIRDERAQREEQVQVAFDRALVVARKGFEDADYETLLILPGNLAALPGD